MRRVLILLAWLCAALAGGPAVSQTIFERLVTPGPLASPHAELEDDCNSCHQSFKRDTQKGQCIACHKEVGTDIRRRTGFHGRYGNARTSSCRTCHSDHQGRSFQLIRFNRNRFNHDLTDYPLRGGHRGVSCNSCHGSGHDYRGTSTNCANCHREDSPHSGQFRNSCQDCHQVAGWTSLKPFDHRAKAGFSLTGSHAQAGCMDCHAGQRWEGVGSACIDCHRADDSHHGSRGTNCASCHRTSRWTDVVFDHDSTGFSLIGGHARASCTGCHGVGNRDPNPSRDCASCHSGEDVHDGGNGTECQPCHVPAGWKRIRFDHDRLTEFPLRGAHRKAECASCHVEEPLVASPPVTCFGCHVGDDKHEGKNGQDCARCHGENAWDEVAFDHDTMTDFPLVGAHSSTECESCHTSPPDDLQLETTCISCHREDDEHAGSLGGNCARCHNSQDWASQIRFDHALTRFPLLGSHSGLECSSCHEDTSYRSAGTACADCHEDEQHAGTLGSPAQCSACHNTVDWAVWSFDHDRQSHFPLTGRHNGLVCAACHRRAGDPAQIGSECVDCHRRDDRHRGEFGDDCERCHVTSSFAEIIIPE